MAYSTELARLQQLRAEKNAAEDSLRIKAEKLFQLYRPMKAQVSTWPSKWHNMYLRHIE